MKALSHAGEIIENLGLLPLPFFRYEALPVALTLRLCLLIPLKRLFFASDPRIFINNFKILSAGELWRKYASALIHFQIDVEVVHAQTISHPCSVLESAVHLHT